MKLLDVCHEEKFCQFSLEIWIFAVNLHFSYKQVLLKLEEKAKTLLHVKHGLHVKKIIRQGIKCFMNSDRS